MKTITAKQLITGAKRFKRLHPIKKRIAFLAREEANAKQNAQEPWVRKKYPDMVQILEKKVDRTNRSRTILERELERRKRLL